MNELENLQRHLSEGRLSRREFMQKATALGVAASVPGPCIQPRPGL